MTTDAMNSSEVTGRSWLAALTREELQDLLRANDLRAWLSLAINWSLVFASFALVAAWPNPLTIIVAVAVIGGRQLGCAALMHDAAHRSLFENRWLNDRVGDWLCAFPIWSDLERYRRYHLQHHAHTGSAEDPDLGLIRPFPVTPASFRRKVWRDLSGQTGRKFAIAAWRRTFSRSREDVRARRGARGFAITNLALLGIVTYFGHPELYLLWAASWLTTHTLVTRVRSIAEHALTPDQEHPLRNTRTVLPRWWERLLVAPNRLNYHLEHHLLMTVPHYNLPRMHRLLQQRGVLDNACIERGYVPVLARAASGGTTPPEANVDTTDQELAQLNGV